VIAVWRITSCPVGRKRFVCYEPLILNKPVRKPVEPLPRAIRIWARMTMTFR